ncbi:hypothetical protein [Megamonas funiformis]|uniref:hypothetical protein n=1 Tax=Megamonas funiformis TaxID=437897 RepID=UPI00265EFEDE|nr:hypothetical protein [Megamonas funiformis]
MEFTRKTDIGMEMKVMKSIKKTDISYVKNYMQYRINHNLPLEAVVIESELISNLGQPLWYIHKILKVLNFNLEYKNR